MNTLPNLARNRFIRSGCSLLLAALLMNGCGELAYKRGASAGDLEAAKKSCQANASDAAAIEKCMADKGWAIQNLDKMEPLDEADPVIEAIALPSNQRIENAASLPPAAPAASPAAVAVNKAPDMLDTFKVSSWWKTGSGAASLQADTDACVARLGDAHRPNTQTQRVTRGLLLCMKDKGWSGLRAK
ncbi:MAG: hypothetical protein B7Z35_02455 [Hydrogenophilales bacterium 12-61-10]|nr:MAG: hypothetical protein B7Z35_02455 [Hydrogenophilales bacterium 12-61-10]OYX31223.1 MAG: hypothetical protein B7Z03_04460 [Hydrogenophilales bacterium 32-62-9]